MAAKVYDIENVFGRKRIIKVSPASNINIYLFRLTESRTLKLFLVESRQNIMRVEIIKPKSL